MYLGSGVSEWFKGLGAHLVKSEGDFVVMGVMWDVRMVRRVFGIVWFGMWRVVSGLVVKACML